MSELPTWLRALQLEGGWRDSPLIVVERELPNYDALCELGGTVVFTAGKLPCLCRCLHESAWKGSVRLVLHPGQPQQSSLPLDLLSPPPTPDQDWMLLLGEPDPDWGRHRPLFGMQIVVTREASQAREWTARLEGLGARVVSLPTLAFHPPDDPQPLEDALSRLGDYDWLIFTSANGVRFFLEALDRSGRDLRQLARARLAAIGPSTAAALASAHLRADLVPPEFVAESLVEAFAAYPLEGARILLPRAQQAREVLPESLRARGAIVEVVAAYRTGLPEVEAVDRERVLAADRVTFASSSSVDNFVTLLGPQPQLPVLAIGPVTARTAREAGFTRVEVAEVYTLEGMTRKLLEGSTRNRLEA